VFFGKSLISASLKKESRSLRIIGRYPV